MGLLLDRPQPFRILGSAAYVPDQIRVPDGRVLHTVTNRDVFEMLFGPDYAAFLQANGKDERYPEEVLGVRERYWSHWIAAPPDHGEITSADLCLEAARRALERADVAPAEIDLFLCANTTPPRPSSSTSALVGGRLGLRAPCMDLKAGCSTGLYALLTAAMYMGGGARTVLVAGAETLSKLCAPGVPQTAFSVGDGAAALVLRASTQPGTGMLAGYMDADGSHAQLITTPGLYPATHEAIDRGEYYMTGDPEALKEIVPPLWPIALGRAAAAAGVEPGKLDLYVPHQVSLKLIRGSADALGIAPERTYVNLHRRANVGGAGLLIALADALAEGRAGPGALVGLNVVGGGLTWAGMVLAL